jgi:AbiV family abortive infection protein
MYEQIRIPRVIEAQWHLDRSLAVLGATKSIENARKLLEDSEVLINRERFGTSYALAIFALEEVAKAFVFHWVADGNLDETDLRKLIYQHRKKHAAIHLMDFFEVFGKFLGPQIVAAFDSDSADLMLNLDKESIERALKEQFSKHMHLLIHAKERREVSLYVDICRRCNAELLGPWLITKSDVDELLRFVRERLGKTSSLIRNCKKHELGVEFGVEVKRISDNVPIKQKSYLELVEDAMNSLDRGAKAECKHVLCSNMKRLRQRTLPQ